MQLDGLSYSRRFSFCSIGESCSGLGALVRIGESIGESPNLGVLISESLETTNEGLCGKGDISMTSIAGAGEDDGSGGVVIVSSIYVWYEHNPSSTYQAIMLHRLLPRPLPCPSAFEENKDRRCVTNCGLFLESVCSFVAQT